MSSLYDYLSGLFKGKAKSVEELRRMGSLMAVRLLQNESVRAELGLSPVQSGQVSALVNEARQKHRPGQVQGKERMQRVAAVASSVLEGLEKSQVLTADQKQRLRQIVWQNRGAAAFADPALQRALELSAAQKQALGGIIDDKQINAAGGREQRHDVRRARQESALALLTPEQKQCWENLKGPPFEVHFEKAGGRGDEAADVPDQEG